MNFLYDLISTQPLPVAKFHGGGKYGKKIFIELLSNVDNNSVKLFCVYTSKQELDLEIKDLITEHNISLIDIDGQSLVTVCDKYNIDRFYSPLPYMFKEIGDIKCEVIGTIHGLRELELNGELDGLNYFSTSKEKFKFFLKYILLSKINKSRNYSNFEKILKKINIITVSNHSKYAIMSYFPFVDEKNINVFYSPDITDNNYKVNSLGGKKYFLLVSGGVWYKNSLRAIKALDSLISQRPDLDYEVKIIGIKDPESILGQVDNKDRFKIYGFVEEDMLLKLYSEAYCLIYMSLNEGFGYPPLESMKFNVPVIASPFTSISEICGDAVMYCNPYSIQEIKNRILNILNADTYNAYRLKATERFILIKGKQDLDLKETIKLLLNN